MLSELLFYAKDWDGQFQFPSDGLCCPNVGTQRDGKIALQGADPLGEQ